MILQSTKVQLKIMCRQKEFRISMLFTLAYASISFIMVLLNNWGVDISVIKDANQSVCYSFFAGYLWSLFLFVYPFLIAVPFSASYINDYKGRLLPVYISRVSRKDYYVSKILAAFIGTGLIMLLPFLFNLLLCNLFLPHNNNMWFGEYQMGNYYGYLLGTNCAFYTPYGAIPLLHLYLFSPFLYNLAYLLIFSMFSGLLGAFVTSISFLFKRNKIILFIPVFVLVRILDAIDGMLLDRAINQGGTYISCNLFEYVSPGGFNCCSPFFITIVIVLISVFIIQATRYAVRNDLESLQ